jgi:hypothetical protein
VTDAHSENPAKNALPMLGHAAKHTVAEKDLVSRLCAALTDSPLPLAQKLQNFPRHVRRQDIARFLAKHELFKLALPITGSVVECGVYAGGGILTWHHLSAIYEPYNHTRRIIGFDTFAGFPSIDAKDRTAVGGEHIKPGALRTHDSMQAEIEALVELHDANRPLGHIPKVELVPGDACVTIPAYLAAHPHLLVSLAYLDFDIYQPTRDALKALLPRIVKGGVIAFDQLNCPEFPGETLAMLETIGIGNAGLRRFPFDPYIAYCIKE